MGIYEVRTYDLKPRSVPDFENGFAESLPGRMEFSPLGGLWHTEAGPLNQVVHIWAFDDEAHMAEAKAKVAQDPDWAGKYMPRVRPLIESQKTYLMKSPDFAPVPQ